MAYQVGGSRVVDNSGNINAGITTGTFFYGDGSNLTNLNGAEITPGTTVERLVAGANILLNPPSGQGTVTITGIGGGGGGSGGGAGILQMDDISGSFNGSTLNFNITIAGLPPNPAPTTQQVIISVGGVVQSPGSAYVVGLAGTLPQVQFIGQAPPAGVSFAGYVISYQYATTSSPGIVRPDNLTIGIGNSGVITALTATNSTKGIVQPDATSISANGSGVISLTNTGVGAGSYSLASITVNAQGRITSASSGSVPSPGNGTIQINQGGVSKGSFTVNQAGNTTINIDSPGPGGGIQAWINFNGQTGGGAVIRRSGNISSVTRLGGGFYQCSMITAASTSDYAIAGTCSQNGDVPGDNYLSSLPINTSTFQLSCVNNTGGSLEDSTFVMATLSYT